MTPDFLASRTPQRGGAAMVVADLNLPQDSVATLLQDARRDAVPLIIVAVSQPKMARLPQELHGLRLLVLNRGELETRVGRALPDQAALAQACRDVQAQGAQDLIITCGGEGVYYTNQHTGADGLSWLPAPQVDVVDVTGAGDAFAAGVCWSIYQGNGDLTLACRRGLKVAAMTLESPDTVSPLLAADILDEINEFHF
jgi:pseudouridine kinase